MNLLLTLSDKETRDLHRSLKVQYFITTEAWKSDVIGKDIKAHLNRECIALAEKIIIVERLLMKVKKKNLPVKLDP